MIMVSSEHLTSTARDACISLVNHYSDPIHHHHHHASSSSSSDHPLEGGRDSDDDPPPDAAAGQQLGDGADDHRHRHPGGGDDDAAGPYFDAVLGRPMPDLPPVCGFWYRRLLEVAAGGGGGGGCIGGGGASSSSSSSSSSDSITAGWGAARELLAQYESSIHPRVVKRRRRRRGGEDRDGGPGGGERAELEVPLDAVVEVLRNYELLVARLMRVGGGSGGGVQSSPTDPGGGDAAAANDDQSIVDSTHTPLDSPDEGGESERTVGIHETSTAGDGGPTSDCDARRVAAAIADDVLRWSVDLPKEDASALWNVRNALLPCLLRLIEHLVVLLPSYENDNIIDDGAASYSTMVRHCLAIATVAAAPFAGDGKLNSGAFGCGSLLDWISGCISNEDGGVDSQEPRNLSIAHTLQECSVPPALSESITTSDFMQRSVVDWSVPSAQFGAPWVSALDDGLEKDSPTNATKQTPSLATCPDSPMPWPG
jgi:hypothetical protein